MPRPPAQRFLYALWGRTPPGLVQVWQLHGRRSTYLRSIADISAFAGQPDVYVGVALTGRDQGRYRRCAAADTTAVAGLWADIDVNGGPDRKTGAAPDEAQAAALAHELLEPTVLVSSGYGLQAWWCFERPWVFEAPADRERAALMAAQWQQLLRERAGEWGFGIDHTHDLARLLRLPGTVNAKGGRRRPVELLACAPQRRHPRDQLAERCAAAGPVQVQTAARAAGGTPVVDVGEGRALAPEVLEALLENSPEFRRTWTHARRKGWSMSEYDLALCSIAAQSDGITDQQLADLIALHRRTWDPADTKGARLDYVQRTVAKARQSADRAGDVSWFRQQRETESRGVAA